MGSEPLPRICPGAAPNQAVKDGYGLPRLHGPDPQAERDVLQPE